MWSDLTNKERVALLKNHLRRTQEDEILFDMEDPELNKIYNVGRFHGLEIVIAGLDAVLAEWPYAKPEDV